MPPKIRFTREEIIASALQLVRTEGMQALTARALGAALGTSSSPVFTVFQSMEEVQAAVLAEAGQLFQSYIRNAVETAGAEPPYKAAGLAYIRFAKEEKALYRLLFLRDRRTETIGDDRESIRSLLTLIQKNTGLDEDRAYRLHLEMWLYVHGIASMIATSYLDWDMEFASSVLTDGYLGLKARYCEEKDHERSHPDRKPDQNLS